jgi:Domain of unknown function (DUF4132)
MPVSKPECRWVAGQLWLRFPLLGTAIGDVRTVVGRHAVSRPCSASSSGSPVTAAWSAGPGAGRGRRWGTVATPGPVRLAHLVDLVADGMWVVRQDRLFTEGRRQPFKQMFRALYVTTAAERAAGPASRLYDGHQLQPWQGLALLGRRGWLSSRETGDIPDLQEHRVAPPRSAPFADHDSKTAEILSKALLLARDRDIKDQRSSSNCAPADDDL